jgi:hypothetical protein
MGMGFNREGHGRRNIIPSLAHSPRFVLAPLLLTCPLLSESDCGEGQGGQRPPPQDGGRFLKRVHFLLNILGFNRL